MEYGGDTLSNYAAHKDLNIETIYEIFLQITEGLKYMEIYKIEHNDIKASNILINFIQELPETKFIDFEIAKNQSFSDRTSTQRGVPGFTDIYMAPELYQANAKGIIDYSLYKPFKFQAYSLGILILDLFRFPSFQEGSKEFDKHYIESLDNYRNFLEKFKKFCKSFYDPLTQKVLKIVKISLPYTPVDRLTAFELGKILSFIKERSLNNIKEDYQKIVLERFEENNNSNYPI